MALSIGFMACSGEDGMDGDPGIQGTPGTPGKAGNNGDNGSDGVNCWDTNGDGDNQDSEDINGDGEFNGLDCQGDNGDDGNPGNDGEDGIDCWDLNRDGIGNLPPENQEGNEAEVYSEDINGDGVVDALDCRGEQGEQGEQGDQGEQGNANVIQYDWDLSNYGMDSGFDFNILDEMDISEQDLPNYTFLFYLVEAEDNLVFPVPAIIYIVNGYRFVRVVYVEEPNNINEVGDVFCSFSTLSDETAYNALPFGHFSSFRVVAIEVSTVINKNGNSSGDVMAHLKAAGVDTSDYHAVMAYFGLEE